MHSKLVDILISEKTVIAVILLNALAMMLQGTDETFTGGLWFRVDYACVLYFLLEAVLKIRRFGWRAYKAKSWNRFDFIILLASLPVLLTPWADLHQFGAVPILRMGRLFRLFRLLRFIPNRDHLVEGVRRALKASVGVFLALFLLNLILAMGATMLFGSLAPEHFGDAFRSFYSIFKVFTVEGWYEIPETLAERAESPTWGLLVRAYFMLAVVLGGLLGFSLANAVFVDEMMMDNNDVLERKIDALQVEIRALRDEIAQLNPGSERPG